MKSLTKLLLLLMIAVAFTSCEKIKGIFDIEVETTINADLLIDVEEDMMKSASGGILFDESVVISVLDDDDVYEHQDKIVDFIVSGLTATVTEVVADGDVVFLDSTVFTLSNGIDPDARWVEKPDWPIEVDTYIDLKEDIPLLGTIGRILLSMEDITANVVGYSNQQPVSVTIKLGIKTTVVANPL